MRELKEQRPWGEDLAGMFKNEQGSIVAGPWWALVWVKGFVLKDRADVGVGKSHEEIYRPVILPLLTHFL